VTLNALEGDTVEKQALSRLKLFNVLHHKCGSAVKRGGDFKLLMVQAYIVKYIFCCAKTCVIDTAYLNNLMNITKYVHT
jgi:hypothetical protein